MTRVLVTGGGGFVGRQVVPHLRDAGFDVVAPSSAEADLLAPGVPAWLAQTTGADVLVHLAWEAAPGYATSAANPEWLRASLELAAAFVAAGGRRIVAAGSCAEMDLERPTPYADCKRALHLGLRGLTTIHGRQLAWARLFFLYGPGEHPQRLVASLASRLAAGEEALATAGRQRRDYLDVRDAGAAIAALRRRERDRPVRRRDGRRARGGRHRAGDRDRGRPAGTAAPRRAAVPRRGPADRRRPGRPARRDGLVPADRPRRRAPRRGRHRLKESDRLPMSTA